VFAIRSRETSEFLLRTPKRKGRRGHKPLPRLYNRRQHAVLARNSAFPQEKWHLWEVVPIILIAQEQKNDPPKG
jgi:hypothetical protein